MALKLYTYLPNYRAWKVLIAAETNGVKIEVPEFEFRKDNRTPEFLQKNPLGKVPVLDTPQGAIFESNAIARFVAGLNPTSDLLGCSFFERARVHQWIDFSASELEPPREIWLYPILGWMRYDQKAYNAARKDVQKSMRILNDHLKSRTFLVGNRISLSDITIACALVELYQFCFDPKFRRAFVNVNRWFDLITHQPAFARVVGEIKLAEAEKEPKQGRQQSKKQKKAKQEKKKPVEKKEAPKPVKKVKQRNPLDLLPRSKMIFDNVKKNFYLDKGEEKQVFFDNLWEEFDHEGYCVYKSEYLYNSDNTVFFMTCNLVAGYLQRLSSLAKYGFGMVSIAGKDEDTGPFSIHGVWIFRGVGIPEEMSGFPDTEYHKLTRLDITTPEGRREAQNLWAGKTVGGQEVLERRIFK